MYAALAGKTRQSLNWVTPSYRSRTRDGTGLSFTLVSIRGSNREHIDLVQ